MTDEYKPIEIRSIEIEGDLPQDVRRELESQLPRAARMAEEMLQAVERTARKAWELARDPRIVSVRIVVRPAENVEPVTLQTDGNGQVLSIKKRRLGPTEARIIIRSDGTSGIAPDDEQ